MERRIGHRQLAEIIALFMIVQFFGLFIAVFSLSPVQTVVVSSSTSSALSSPFVQAAYDVVSIAVFAILILAVLRLYKNKGALLFRLVESFAVGFGTIVMFFFILATIFYNVNAVYTAAVAVMFGAAVVIAKNRVRHLRNFAALTSSIGLGIIIGNYGFVLAYAFMFIMAVYDYIAVFVTKHMLVLAKAASNENLSLLIGSSNVEVVPRAQADKKVLAELRSEVKKKQINDPVIMRIIDSGEMPVLSQIQLGTGDLTLPLVMSVGLFISMTYFSVPVGGTAMINVYYLPVVAALGAVAGLLFTMWLLKRYSVALPAIPPLFAVMNFFIGAGMLAYSKPADFLAGVGLPSGSYLDYYLMSAGMMVVGVAFLLLMIITLERNKGKLKSGRISDGKPARLRGRVRQ